MMNDKMRFLGVGFVFLFMILGLPFCAAIDSVEVEPVRKVIVPGQAAIFDADIVKGASSGDVEVFNLQTNFMLTSKKEFFRGLESKKLRLEFYPKTDVAGSYVISFFIKSNEATVEKNIRVRIVNLEDVIEVSFLKAGKEDKKLAVEVWAKEGVEIEDTTMSLKGGFFEYEEEFNLGSNEKKSFEFDVESVEGGVHNVLVKVLTEVNGEDREFTKMVELEVEEHSDIEERRETEGVFVRTVRIILENEGNTRQVIERSKSLSVFSRFFTSFEPKPVVDRKAGKLIAMWEIDLEPGEEVVISARTNYLLPIILLIVFLAAVLGYTAWKGIPLKISKKVEKLKSKKPFAMKIVLALKARNELKGVILRDYLPSVTKLHEDFGTVKPHSVKGSMIEWRVPKMEKGEERIFSYVVYSDVEVIGSLEVPRAQVICDVKGKEKRVMSEKVTILS